MFQGDLVEFKGSTEGEKLAIVGGHPHTPDAGDGDKAA